MCWGDSVEFVPRYIKTSGNATVDHLSKYLAVRLALEELRRNADASPVNVEAASEKQYTIYIPTPGNQFTVSLLKPTPPVLHAEQQGHKSHDRRTSVCFKGLPNTKSTIFDCWLLPN